MNLFQEGLYQQLFPVNMGPFQINFQQIHTSKSSPTASVLFPDGYSPFVILLSVLYSNGDSWDYRISHLYSRVPYYNDKTVSIQYAFTCLYIGYSSTMTVRDENLGIIGNTVIVSINRGTSLEKGTKIACFSLIAPIEWLNEKLK